MKAAKVNRKGPVSRKELAQLQRHMQSMTKCLRVVLYTTEAALSLSEITTAKEG
jgi:hypothetical protein